MDDSELDQIRQRRMQELMAKQGFQGAGMGGMDPEEQEKQEEARRQAEDQRHMMLRSILTSEARERLARVALVKPEKARGVENMLIAAAQRGQITEKVSEERLVGMLTQVQEREASSKPKITIQRRRPLFEDDE